MPWACRWFLDQHLTDTDLLVVGDGPGTVADLVPADERIRYLHLKSSEAGPIPLGRKYNACVARARGPLIALWSDDDWHAPWKLAHLLVQLRGKSAALIAGARSMLFHRVGAGQTWVYDKPGDPSEPYFLGGSLLFEKRYWLGYRKFDGSARRAADASFTNHMVRDEYAEIAAVVPRDVALGMYVATIHPTNTGRPDVAPEGPGWSPWPESAVAELMQSAYDLWQPGGAICDRIRP